VRSSADHAAGSRPRALCRELQQRRVEVVAAEVVVARVRDHFVLAVAHPDQRHVERAAAEVVHQHVLARRGQRLAVPVRVLDARRRGLVEQAHDGEPGRPAGVHHQEPLGGRGPRRDRDHHLEGLAFGQGDREVRAVQDVVPQRGQEAGHHVEDGDLVLAHLHVVVVPRGRQQALEGAVHGPAADAHLRERVPAVQPLPRGPPARVDGEHGGPVVDDLAVPGLEAHHGVVAPIHHRHDGARGPEIDAEPHGSPRVARGITEEIGSSTREFRDLPVTVA
jgi:hypothetical protein